MPVLVKICGITRVEDAVAAARFGADFIGLNFYPGSPRCISEGQARLILQALPDGITAVGLFVNESWEHIGEVATRLGITMVQVHGEQLSPCPLPDLRWIAAFSIKGPSTFSDMGQLLQRSPSLGRIPAAILVDAHVPGAYGGTGQTAPWEVLTLYRPAAPIVLAGGLTLDNIAEAIRIVRPWAVDVASGVESSPGVKDHDKMRRFIENAKTVT